MPVPATQPEAPADQKQPVRRRRFARFAVAIALFLLFAIFILPYLLPLPGGAGLTSEELAPAGGRFVTAAGTTTYVEEAGPGDGPPILLIHGFGGSTFSWRETLPALGEAGYRTVALDLRGFGLSDKEYDADYGHPAQAAFVTTLMDELGIDEAFFVGHSMGGNVVAHIAQQSPGRVSGLIMVDAAVVQGELRESPWYLRIAPLRRWLRIGLRLAFTEDRYQTILESSVADPALITPEVTASYYRPQRVANWDLALLGIMRDRGRNALRAPLQEVTRPTLIVWGESDEIVPLGAGRSLHAALPNSELVVMDNTGHLPMEERPAEFNRILLDWLQAQ